MNSLMKHFNLAKVWRKALASAALVLTLPHAVLAAETPELPVARYNVGLDVFETELPHGKPFLIEFTVSGDKADNNEVTGLLWEGEDCEAVPKVLVSSSPTKTAEKGSDKAQVLRGTAEDKDEHGKRKFALAAPPLRYDTSYCVRFTLSRDWGDADRDAVKKAQQEILAAAVGHGSYDEALIKKEAEAALGSRAKLEVLPAGAMGKDAKTVPLLAVVNGWFKLDALQPLFDAQREHWKSVANARSKVQKLVAAGGRPDVAPLGDKLPLAVVRFEDEFDKLKAAGDKAPRFTEEVSAASAEKEKNEPPVAPTEDERLYVERLDLLMDAGKLVSTQCAPAPAGLNKDYCAKLTATIDLIGDIKRNIDVANTEYTRYTQTSARLLTDLGKSVDAIQVQLKPSLAMTGRPSYTERSTFYMSADVGGVLPVFVGDRGFGGQDISVFLGVNFYLTAVDKNTPLAKDDGFFKRFSFTAGWTLNDVKDSSGRTKGVLDGKGLMVGGGFRATDYLRFGAGAMWVRQNDRNPVVTETHVRAVPYLAASIDLDVAGTLRDAFKKYQE
jgi:hypothetical protein